MTRPWSEADNFARGELDHRIELVDGHLWPAPTPTMPHQDVSHVLLHSLRASARRAGLRAYEGVVLRLDPGRLIVPDLVVARVDRLATHADAADTVLVGEITSPGNPFAGTPDRIALCAAARIPWLLLAQPESADHEALTLRLFQLAAGHYLEYAAAAPGHTLTSSDPFPFRIRTGDLVAF